MSDNTQIYDKVMDILTDVTGDPVVREDPDINLPEEGLIDSMGYMELLMDVEDSLGIVIAPAEYTRAEMDTPRKIATVVESKSR